MIFLALLAFPLDHVVKTVLTFHLALGQSKDKLFMIFRKDQTIKSTVIPLYVLDGTDEKRDWVNVRIYFGIFSAKFLLTPLFVLQGITLQGRAA